MPSGLFSGSGTDACRIRRVVVRAVREAVVQAGFVERLGRAAPLLLGEAVADDGAVRAVVVVAVSGVGLQLAEVRQRVLESPLVVAPGRPAVVVVRHAAQEYLPVDRAGAAGDLAARHQHRLRLLGGARRELPVVVARHDVGRRRVAVLHLFRQVVDVGVVRACFKEQDGGVWVFGETGRQNRARRASADDDVVVLHGCSFEMNVAGRIGQDICVYRRYARSRLLMLYENLTIIACRIQE